MSGLPTRAVESNVDWFRTYGLRFTRGESARMTRANQCIAIILGLFVTLLSVQVGHAQERSCTELESRMLHDAFMPRTWETLYQSYRSYRLCDDGAIGEGYSESVARLLVDHWNTLPQLAHLARKDAEFRAFVMRHVDATLNMDDVEKIRKNAKTLCPTGLRTVCNGLAKQADSALKEDAASPEDDAARP
jgi:hypothetical protein